MLDQVGMTGFEKRPVHTLSGGQKQRLTIACALISNRNFIPFLPTTIQNPGFFIEKLHLKIKFSLSPGYEKETSLNLIWFLIFKGNSH